MLTLGNYVQAAVVSFGSGANQFNMEFVTIGKPGNAADTTGNPNPAGRVGYVYGMGKFEVSEDMIDKYNASFGTANSLVIFKDYRGANKPVTSISWNQAARFVNWLNISTGSYAAYKFTTGGVNDDIALWAVSDTLDYDASNPYRSKRARYVLPSYNEWYKAAYYNPNDSTYYDYANGSNTAPIAVVSGTTANNAVFTGNGVTPTGPADVDQAGGLSPYGVMGLGGNVAEWEENSFDLANSINSYARELRGGNWSNLAVDLSSASRYSELPSIGSSGRGFRVASLSSSGGGQVPEPSTMAIFGLGALGMAYRHDAKTRLSCSGSRYPETFNTTDMHIAACCWFTIGSLVRMICDSSR